MGNKSCKQEISYDYRSSNGKGNSNWTCIDELKNGCKKDSQRKVNISPRWYGETVTGFENMEGSVQPHYPTDLTHASFLDHKVKHKPAPAGTIIEGMDDTSSLYNETKEKANQAMNLIQSEADNAKRDIQKKRMYTENVKDMSVGGMRDDRNETKKLADETRAFSVQAKNQNNSSQYSANEADRARTSTENSEKISREMKGKAIVSAKDSETAKNNSLLQAGMSHLSSQDAETSAIIAQQQADEAKEGQIIASENASDSQVLLNNMAVDFGNQINKNQKEDIIGLQKMMPDSPDMIVKGAATDRELQAIQDTTDQVIGALVESGGRSEGVSVQGFTNYEGMGNKRKNIEGFTQSAQLTKSEATKMGTDLMQSMHRFRNILTEQRQVTAEHNRIAAMNEIAEIASAKKDIGTDIFLDYISSDDGSDIHKVYEKKKYDNLKNERLIQTQEYEMRIYEEYINIAKVLVIAFVIYAIFAFLNSKSIIGDQLTKILNIIILATAIFFTIGKIIWLSLRDPINFDKTKQGYDRQYIHDMSGNKYPSKSYNLGMLTGTCIGEACCGPEMIYDSGENTCVEAVAEGFENNSNGSLLNDNNNIIESMSVKKAQQEILENMFQKTQ